jgi:hypothetical protein
LAHFFTGRVSLIIKMPIEAAVASPVSLFEQPPAHHQLVLFVTPAGNALDYSYFAVCRRGRLRRL